MEHIGEDDENDDYHELCLESVIEMHCGVFASAVSVETRLTVR